MRTKKQAENLAKKLLKYDDNTPYHKEEMLIEAKKYKDVDIDAYAANDKYQAVRETYRKLISKLKTNKFKTIVKELHFRLYDAIYILFDNGIWVYEITIRYKKPATK